MFNHKKSDLTPDEIKMLLDFKKHKCTIEENIRNAEKAYIYMDLGGLIPLNVLKESIDFAGCLFTKSFPSDPDLADFFSQEGKTYSKGEYVYMRGPRYLCALDVNLRSKQKVKILGDDCHKGITLLSLLISKGLDTLDDDSKLWFLGVIDYIKNGYITLFNALVTGEKLGNFKFDDKKYQSIRADTVQSMSYVIQIYYDTLFDMSGLQSIKNETLGAIQKRLDKLKNYLENDLETRILTRAESTHPLTIAASTYLITQNYPSTDIIFAMPSGGTEAGLVLRYIFMKQKRSDVDLYLLPISLHSIKDIVGEISSDRIKNIFSLWFKNADIIIDDKDIFIIDDNTSTGRTIATVAELLSSHGKFKWLLHRRII